MERSGTNLRRIETNFAACEGTQLASYCALGAFVAVYLSHRNCDDFLIGLTTSLGAAMAIVLQLILSNAMDRHPEFPIKYTISILAAVGAACALCMCWLPMPSWLMIIVFAVCLATGQSNCGYLNAQLMQFNNVGIPARIGWPRGVGSISYAIGAWIYGLLDPDLLPMCFALGSLICIECVLMMPDPYHGRDLTRLRATGKSGSYAAMFKGNTALIVLLACVALNNAGVTAGLTFTVRVVERVGGGNAEYGVSEFIRAAVELPALVASGFLLKRYKTKALMAASFFFNSVRTLLMAIAPSVISVYLISTINMLCVGLSLFAGVLLVNSIVRENEKVRGQSLLALCSSIGSIIGSAYAGVLIGLTGLNAMLLISSAFCMTACLVLCFCCHPDKVRLD